MKPRAYYNEIDEYCCNWLCEMMANGLVYQSLLSRQDDLRMNVQIHIVTTTTNLVAFLRAQIPIDKILCRKLARLRRQWRISLAELSEESGYSEGSFRQWEANCKSRTPRAQTVRDWVDSLLRIRKRHSAARIVG